MKICLVTTFPPSTGGLSEYGFHIANELKRNPFLNLTVLADELPNDQAELDGFSVLRCWSFNHPASVVRLMSTLHRLKPDVVWFNLLFSTFGRNPVVAFSGLMTPLLARLSGRYTHVTLHHLMDTVELKDAGIRYQGMYRIAGAMATRMLLLSNSVSVLMPGYRKILNDKYGRDNVHLRAHGILARRPEFPDFSRRGSPHRILAFGKWGTYKRLELMIEAFNLLGVSMPDVQLIVAGGDHPQAVGYTESMKQQCAGNPRIEFRGYIPEDALPELFQSSSVAVMPYSSSTGCSGVAHLACAYGVPVVCADLLDFRQMAQAEELAMEFYPPESAQGLADCLTEFLQNSEKQHVMAEQNFSTALRMTMPNVVQKYLRHFELQQRVQTLKHVSRVRRLPRWIPSKSLLRRLMTRNSLSWARRSAMLHAPWNNNRDPRLLHIDDNVRGKLNRAGNAVHRDDIAVGGSGSGGGRGGASLDGAHAASPARSTADNQTSQNANAKHQDDLFPLKLADQSRAKQSEAENPNAQEGRRPFVVVRRSDGSGNQGQDGSGAVGSWGDGRGGE
jgi:glycosyltransferase involved in cell wall biosynthesis